MKKHYIYSLRCPLQGRVRYVGQSIDLEYRLKQHISEALCSKPDSSKCLWIKSVLAAGLQIEQDILEVCDYEHIQEREAYWIEYFGRENLLNENSGGATGPIVRIDNAKQSSSGEKGNSPPSEDPTGTIPF